MHRLESNEHGEDWPGRFKSKTRCSAMQTRGATGSLFRKYALYFASLVTLDLRASGLTSLAFSYRDNRALVNALHREKAGSAAA